MKFKNFLIVSQVAVLLLFMSSMLYGKGISNNLQSLDDNQLLASDTSKWNLLSEIKDIPLSKKEHPVTLSFGGSIRQQYRGYYRLGFGDDVPSNDIYAMQRYIINADLRISKIFSLYAELSNSTVNGKNSIRSTDKDNLGLIQAYADIKFSAIPMQLSVGRQELDFGSGRVLGRKDGPNNGAYYDGVHDTIGFKKILSLHLFIAHPLEYKVGVFDNYTNTDILIFGSYWSVALKNDKVFDLYFIANQEKDVPINEITANEKRYTIGTRAYKEEGAFLYDVEAIWQTGTFGEKNISAWQLQAAASYEWDGTRLNPEVQIKASAFSSEKDATDQTLNLFRPIASKPAANKFLPLGPANFVMLAPNAGISITKNLDFNLTYYAIWRKNLSDGLYSGSLENMIKEPDTANVKNGRHVANGPYLTFIYEPNDHFAFTFNTGILFPGEYLENTSKGVAEAVKGFFLKAEYEF